MARPIHGAAVDAALPPVIPRQQRNSHTTNDESSEFQTDIAMITISNDQDLNNNNAHRRVALPRSHTGRGGEGCVEELNAKSFQVK